MAENPQHKLGAQLRNLRQQKHKTQQDLAGHLRITQPSYSDYERGKTPIPLSRLAQICTYLNVDVTALLQLVQEMGPETEDEEDAAGPVLDAWEACDRLRDPYPMGKEPTL